MARRHPCPNALAPGHQTGCSSLNAHIISQHFELLTINTIIDTFCMNEKSVNTSYAGNRIFRIWGSISCLLIPWLLKSKCGDIFVIFKMIQHVESWVSIRCSTKGVTSVQNKNKLRYPSNQNRDLRYHDNYWYPGAYFITWNRVNWASYWYLLGLIRCIVA